MKTIAAKIENKEQYDREVEVAANAETLAGMMHFNIINDLGKTGGLIEKGADLSIPDENGNNSLHLAAIHNKQQPVFKFIKVENEKFSEAAIAKNNELETPIESALKTNEHAIFRNYANKMQQAGVNLGGLRTKTYETLATQAVLMTAKGETRQICFRDALRACPDLVLAKNPDKKTPLELIDEHFTRNQSEFTLMTENVLTNCNGEKHTQYLKDVLPVIKNEFVRSKIQERLDLLSTSVEGPSAEKAREDEAKEKGK